MNKLTLKPDGGILHNKALVHNQPLICLGFQVNLDPGFRLRSFFRMMERYGQLQQPSEFIPPHMQQYRDCPQSGCTHEGFDHLEFGKTIEMIGLSGKARLEIFTTLTGVSRNEVADIRNILLVQLLDMPVKLGKLKHIIFGDGVDVLTCDTVFSLFEMIDGILWQLSFQGTLTACDLRR